MDGQNCFIRFKMAAILITQGPILFFNGLVLFLSITTMIVARQLHGFDSLVIFIHTYGNKIVPNQRM